MTDKLSNPPSVSGSPDKGLDELTEQRITDFGRAKYYCGVVNYEQPFHSKDERAEVLSITVDALNALRSRIQTLVSEARKSEYQRAVDDINRVSYRHD